MVNTTALTIDVNLLFDGKVYASNRPYELWGLSAHNPVACVDLIAKVCVKVAGLTWTDHVVQGELELGVGIILVGVKYFKITHFSFDYVSAAAPPTPQLRHEAPGGRHDGGRGPLAAVQSRYGISMQDFFSFQKENVDNGASSVLSLAVAN